MDRRGRVGAVTNVFMAGAPDPGAVRRGGLVVDWLSGDKVGAAAAAARLPEAGS